MPFVVFALTFPGMAHLPRLFLVRHGETAWSLSKQHTGWTDLPLTPHGERQAIDLVPRLAAFTFAHVFTSPLQRARRTCELAGFADRATIDPDLREWNYGRYDGLTTVQIHERDPAWNVFDHGGEATDGETPAQMLVRTDRMLAKLRAAEGDTLVFGHGHALRALAARWLGLPIAGGKLLALGVATLSQLSYEHDLSEPTILTWNA